MGKKQKTIAVNSRENIAQKSPEKASYDKERTEQLPFKDGLKV